MIFFTAGKKITGFQEFPNQTKEPHVIINDELLIDKIKNVVGYAVLDSNNAFSDDSYLQALKQKNTDELNELLSDKLLQAKKNADAFAQKLVWEVPDVEKETWASQEQEARAWLIDNNSPCPVLTDICTARGLTIDVLAPKVIAKADYYRAQASKITGCRQKIEDDLKAAYALKDIFTTPDNELAEIQNAINHVQAIITEIDFVI